jgi:hypothetical protein
VGLFRKMTSLSTLGAVDFKSDKERTANYTKAAAKEAKEQTRLMRLQAAQEALRLQAEQTPQSAHQPVAAMPAPQLPPAGWYPDQADLSLTRWFDGTKWTEFTQPRI